MPIGIGEDHEELPQDRFDAGWRVTARLRSPAALSMRSSRASSPLGRAGRAGLALGSTSPRSTVARASDSSSWPWWSRRWPGLSCPARRCRPCWSARSWRQPGTIRPRKELLAGLVDGTTPAAVALPGSGAFEADLGDDGSLTLRGTLRPVLGAGVARAPGPARRAGTPTDHNPWAPDAGAGREVVWCLVDLTAPEVGGRAHHQPRPHPAGGRRPVDGIGGAALRQLPSLTSMAVRDAALAIAAAECAGERGGASRSATAARQGPAPVRPAHRPVPGDQAPAGRHARLGRADDRPGLGRGPGRRCGRRRAGRAVRRAGRGASPSTPTWSAPRACIQILGGHGLHLGARRPPPSAPGPARMRQLLGGRRAAAGGGVPGRAGRAAGAVLDYRAARPDAERSASEIRGLVAEMQEPPRTRTSAAAGSSRTGSSPRTGPPPYGSRCRAGRAVGDRRGVGRRRALRRPTSRSGRGRCPTIIAHGTQEQQERWVGPTLRGRARVVPALQRAGRGQRPGVALSTRADARSRAGSCSTGRRCGRRCARKADWGICLARTDPDASKHAGITYFLVDMTVRGDRDPAAARDHRRRRCSTRCSSPTSSSPTTAWWGR